MTILIVFDPSLPPPRHRRALHSMTGSTWTLPEQANFLTERYHTYLAFKETGDLRVFWSNVTSAFFTEWPSQDAEIAAEAGSARTLPGGKKSKSKHTRKLYSTHTEWTKARKEVSRAFSASGRA